MAADDKDPDRETDEDRGGNDAGGSDRPGRSEPPFSIAFGDGTARVDRDDDSGADGTTPKDRDKDSDDGAPSAFYVDSDYPDDFPEPADARHEDATRQIDEADPGFAAFPDEFDDPLADWPAPNADLDSLPEMRERAASGAGAEGPLRDGPFADGSLAGDDADGTGPGNPQATTPGRLADELPDVPYFDDPVEHDPSDNDANTAPRESTYGNAIVDSDEPAPGSDDGFFAKVEAGDAVEELPGAQDMPLPAVTELPDPLDIEDVGEDAYGDIDDLPSLADDASGPDDSDPGDDADDDAFIDDFLNDLDEPDDARLREDPVERDRDFPVAPADAADDSLAPQGNGRGSAAVAQYGAGILDANDARSDSPAMDEKGGEGMTAASDDEDPRLPWGLIAVVALALLLLAAGGFGVVQQRSNLKAEIRDLQAQLATAVAPEEAAAERERLRQIELENESLAAELAALEAENGALSEQLASLESRLEEQVAAQEGAARETEAAAAAAPSAAQSTDPARAGSASTPAAEDSGWFVNFGSYAQDQVAQRWADRLDVSAGRVVVQEARASGRTLYRVRVVGLQTQDAAERVAAALERQHQLPRLWVGRY